MKVFLLEFNPFQPVQTPISLGYLAAFIRRKGHEVCVLALGSDSSLSVQGFSDRILSFHPDIVGFSAYQRNIFLVHGWARLCKKLLPECTTVIGGPQAVFMPTRALKDLPFLDLICRAEGECALAELVRVKAEWPGVKNPISGWSGRSGENLWDGADLELSTDLDDYPSPYLDGTLDVQGQEEAILLSSRGCPYHCAFCYTPAAFGKKIRLHAVERVIEEIDWIVSKGVKRFWFADPSFTFYPNRVHQLLDGILARGRKPAIWLETRVDLVNEELLRKMKHAGVHTVAYGLESASKAVLTKIQKPLDLDQAERAVRLTQEVGIEVELFSQYGLPGERIEDAIKTLRFVQKSRVKVRGNTNPQQMQIYFGSDIHRHPGMYGIRPFPEVFPSYLSVGSRYETEWMCAEEIQEIGRMWKQASLDGGKHIVS
jgi:anaerobic magnesium-protoporphyrin IX monomethyl ester cyclase